MREFYGLGGGEFLFACAEVYGEVARGGLIDEEGGYGCAIESGVADEVRVIGLGGDKLVAHVL